MSDILIVDDERDIRELVSDILEDEGYETRQAASAEAAVEEIGARRPSLVILDIWLEGSRIDGMELLHILRREHPDVPVVMISGFQCLSSSVGISSSRLRLTLIKRATFSARSRYLLIQYIEFATRLNIVIPPDFFIPEQPRCPYCPRPGTS